MRTPFQLESFSLKNYKCFDHKATMCFAPLTLVLGHNSAGKSLMVSNIANMFKGIENINGTTLQPLDWGQFPPVSFRSMKLKGNFELDFEMNLEINDYFLAEDNRSLFISFVFTNLLTNRSYSVYLLRDIGFKNNLSGENDNICPNSIDHQTIEDHLSFLNQGHLKPFLMKLLNGKEKVQIEISNEWVVYGGWKLEQHLIDLKSPKTNEIKKFDSVLAQAFLNYKIEHYWNKLIGNRWHSWGLDQLLQDVILKNLKKSNSNEMRKLDFGKYPTKQLFPSFDKPNFDSIDCQEEEFESGFKKINWLFDSLIRTYSKLSHMGPLRERPSTGWTYVDKDQSASFSEWKYLSNTGDLLWPLIEFLKVEAEEELINADDDWGNPCNYLLSEINGYLTYLDTHTLLSIPENQTNDSEDYYRIAKRNIDKYPLLSEVEKFWLEKLPKTISQGVYGLVVWRNLGAELELVKNEYKDEIPTAALTAIRSKIKEAQHLCKLLITPKHQQCSTRVGISQVGSGISQVLPILVNLALARHRMNLDLPQEHIIITEQPELHLHPKAQANLADIFMHSLFDEYQESELAEEGRWPTIAPKDTLTHIIETHSEKFILRIKKRVEEGQIRPEMIAINYVWQDQEGRSHVKHIGLDKMDEAVGSWLNEFFSESFN